MSPTRTFLARLGAPAAILALTPALHGVEAVRVLERTARSVTLELTLPAEAFKALRPGGPVAIPGWARTARPGWPELPVRGLLIRVPSSGGIHYEVLEERHGTLAELRPALVPPRGGDVQEEADQALQEAGLYPAEVLDLSEPMVLNGQTMVRALFHPFRFEAGTGRLEASQVIRVRILFDEALEEEGIGTVLGAAAPPTLILGRAGAEVSPSPAPLAVVEGATASIPGPATVLPGQGTVRMPTVPTGQKRLRLEVTGAGLHRLAYEDLPLLAMGLPLLAPGALALTCQGQPVPLRVVCANGASLAPGDYLEFYGQKVETAFSSINVYALAWEERPRTRLQTQAGDPGGPATVTSCPDLLRVEKNTTFWSVTPGAPAQDFWLWQRLLAPASQDYPFTLAAADAAPATLRVRFLGNTTSTVAPGHHVRMILNGTTLGDTYWSGLAAQTVELSVPVGLLTAGGNTLTLSLPGDTGAVVDEVWLNNFEVQWSHPIQAVNDAVTFTVQGSGAMVIQAAGFSGQDLRLQDVTDPMVPRAITGFKVTGVPGAYQLTFQDAFTGTRTYYAGTGAASLKPSSVTLWPATGIRRSALNGADYILVTSRSLLAAAEPLLAARRAQGLRAVGVAMEDIYGEFSNGLLDPQALKDFLTYAYQHWTPPAPQYVLLLGDASFDFHNYQGYGKQNIVPVHFTVMPDLGLTPDDNWYVTAGQANDLPVMMLGRLTAATPAAVTTQIQKILQYEQSTTLPASTALFVADDQLSDFEAIGNELAAMVPAPMQVAKTYVSQYEALANGVPSGVNTSIRNAFNQGVSFVSYLGHGNTGFWTRNIFQTSDVALLTNSTQLPFVVSFDCLTGYFAAPGYYSLGETLVAAPGKGAIAVFGSSGLGYTWEHELLGVALFKRLFQANQTTLGQLATQSKLDAFAQGATADTVRMFNLLGDPAMRLKAHP